MERERVVDRAADPLLLEERAQCVAPPAGDPNAELIVDVADRIGGFLRQGDLVFELRRGEELAVFGGVVLTSNGTNKGFVCPDISS